MKLEMLILLEKENVVSTMSKQNHPSASAGSGYGSTEKKNGWSLPSQSEPFAMTSFLRAPGPSGQMGLKSKAVIMEAGVWSSQHAERSADKPMERHSTKPMGNMLL